MSNREVQPLQFRCKGCGSPIALTLHVDFKAVDVRFEVKGAALSGGRAFEEAKHFVDLHLDFPVSFGPYVMGNTPFMMAAQRIGHQQMHIHKIRLEWLNEVYKISREIKALLTLYANGRHELFKDKVWNFLEHQIACDTQLDVNRALYLAIEKAFFPFAEPTRNVDAVQAITKLQIRLAKRDKAALHSYMNEIVESGFLKAVQSDCLEIYPRILDLELMFRPALFLDFDRSYRPENFAYRVSAHEFNDAKDLFKDIAEIMSKAIVLVAGLNNLARRGDHNKFAPGPKMPASLKEFSDWPLGFKLQQLDHSWYHINASDIDNRLRNSIAHYKVEVDEIAQLITYFPKKEGLEQKSAVQMHFLDFSRKILGMFREMHRLNHFTKCLFVYYYLHMEGVEGTPFPGE